MTKVIMPTQHGRPTTHSNSQHDITCISHAWFHPGFDGRDFRSTLLDNLWRHIFLATEAPSGSLNYSLRYINNFIYLSIYGLLLSQEKIEHQNKKRSLLFRAHCMSSFDSLFSVTNSFKWQPKMAAEWQTPFGFLERDESKIYPILAVTVTDSPTTFHKNRPRKRFT